MLTQKRNLKAVCTYYPPFHVCRSNRTAWEYWIVLQ